jgi:hypothetical protein
MAVVKAKTQLITKLNNKWKFGFYLWLKLPAAFYSGVRLVKANENEATASVPYKRMSQNPFGSTYFACLAMAAELSTGVLCLIAASGFGKKISMLVVSVQGDFEKKATGITYFTCNDGAAIFNAMQNACNNKPAVVTCISKGFDLNNQPIASFKITWSFKAR